MKPQCMAIQMKGSDLCGTICCTDKKCKMLWVLFLVLKMATFQVKRLKALSDKLGIKGLS